MTSEFLHLLVVEDSEDDAELICIELKKAGFALEWRRVETEEDFVEALDGEAQWDLIISDFQMPQFNGLRAFALYKERDLDIPFIFVSGALGEERAVEAMRAGARDYLLKGNLARLNVAVNRELRESTNRRSQRLAQESAGREQRRLAVAVEASGAGVFEHRIPAGPDMYFSERWAEILGYTLDEIPPYDRISEWIFEQVHPDDVSQIRRAYGDFIEGRAPRYAVEHRMRHKQGHWIEVAASAKANERDASGRAVQVVGVLLDQSDRHHLEAQLRHAQKMEAVGRLAGGIAHDFNNLLTAILGYAEIALLDAPEETELHQHLSEIRAAGDRATSLTRQLLSFSRKEIVAPRTIHLGKITSNLDRMLKRLIGEDIELVTVVDPELAYTRADPGQIEQIILNLVVNARDAMPTGGKITIELGNVRFDERYVAEHLEASAGEYVMLAVTDTGTGMSEATRERIFEPFFTTKEEGRGTGLGLATVYAILKQYEGHIGVYSEPGHGTTFKLYFPVVEEEPTEERESGVMGEVRGGTETILLVEDEDSVLDMMTAVLKSKGYTVLTAEDGESAIPVAVQAEAPIHLVITDIVMPRMNGTQLAGRLRQMRPNLPILFLSGYTGNAVLHQGILESGADFLQKPFRTTDLCHKVREVLDRTASNSQR